MSTIPPGGRPMTPEEIGQKVSKDFDAVSSAGKRLTRLFVRVAITPKVQLLREILETIEGKR